MSRWYCCRSFLLTSESLRDALADAHVGTAESDVAMNLAGKPGGGGGRMVCWFCKLRFS